MQKRLQANILSVAQDSNTQLVLTQDGGRLETCQVNVIFDPAGTIATSMDGWVEISALHEGGTGQCLILSQRRGRALQSKLRIQCARQTAMERRSAYNI